jgi:3-hydroxyacyl-CoA dehydrogenase
MKVLVVGAGTMGSGIAQVSAMSGYDTVVVDVSKEFLDRGRERIMDSLQRLSKRGVDPSTVLSKLTFSTEMKDGSGAEVAIEVVPEKLEIKLDVFKRMESILSSGSLLATNTSSIPISEIASGIERKQMLVGLHFFNPLP